jgi:hypothetical protein
MTPKMKRLVFLTDEHYPHTIPAVHDIKNPRKESPLIRFLKDFDPHYIVAGGDQLDLSVIAHWNKGKARINENKRLKPVYDEYNAILDQREKACKSLERHIMLQGNHEAWIEMLLDEQPAFEGMVEVEKNLNLKSRGIEWIDQRKHARIGHLYFIHGNYKKGYTAAYAAKAIAQLYGKNILFGHFHSNQVYSASTPFDSQPYQVTGVGCLCDLNPIWKQNEPSAWTNALWVGYILPNGNYHGHTINIINNQFVYDGQLYA